MVEGEVDLHSANVRSLDLGRYDEFVATDLARKRVTIVQRLAQQETTEDGDKGQDFGSRAHRGLRKADGDGDGSVPR